MTASPVQWIEVGGELKPFVDGRDVFWAPQPGSQQKFLETPWAFIFEALYHGTRGGGKTDCMLVDFAQHVGQGFGADWRGVLFRQTYKQLEDVVNKSKRLFKRLWPAAKFNQTAMTWTWPTGEELLFRYMEKPEDYQNYHGHAFPWIGWEELTTWATPDCYLKVMSLCRSSRANMPRKYRATTNPYGPGHNWVKARFMPSTKQVLGPIIEEETWETDPVTGLKFKVTTRRVSIFSHIKENRVLLKADPGYMGKLRQSASNQAELAAWTEGDWDIVSGGMFDDIWLLCRDKILLPPFQVPATWRITRSFDWGSSKPFSVGWWAESDGSDLWLPGGKKLSTLPRDVFRIKEWYGWTGEPNKGVQMLAKDIAKGIIERELQWGIYGRVGVGIADASIFDEENGNCIAFDMEEPVVIDDRQYRGVMFDPADKRSGSRKQGWEQVRKLLRATKPEEGKPREKRGMFITEDCLQFLRTMPALPRDPRDPDDVDSDAEDHVADEVRYFARMEHRFISGSRTTGMV